MTTEPNEIDSIQPVASAGVLIAGTLAIIAGTLVSAVVLPAWLPGLVTSILGEAPKAYWFLSRGTAFVAFGLLWASMALGLIITNRLARLWPGGPVAFDLHQYVSLLGLGFGLFHALILLGDHFINFNLAQVLLPFAAQSYKPVWVGFGQLAFYGWGLLVGSFYVRKQLGNKTWRLIHFASFLTFAMVMVHGVVSGSDTNTIWGSAMYWASGGSLLLLVFYRIFVTTSSNKTSSRTGASARA